MSRMRLTIRGRVQGVGCRPFIYRLATELGLAGTVRNDTQGVTIEVQGPAAALERFAERLCERSAHGYPALMRIDHCTRHAVANVPDDAPFRIIESDAAGSPVSQVTPDCATCAACLREMRDPEDFRCRYPFINCTHCGPRYSIVKTIPYDRPNTTMGAFDMCSVCRSQYTDVTDRRFHAQPVACPTCGPTLWLAGKDGQTLQTDTDSSIAGCAEILRNGGIAAIKGIGGFHLAVDAFNEQAVAELRRRKHRDAKPFAMMAASMEIIRRHASVDALAAELLNSPESPIVLLDKKEPVGLAPSVAPGTHRFGFMLPYAPLHHLLFDEAGIEVLVMTSANLSDEPLICKNDQALEELGTIADVFVMHNRDIYRQVDDSVVHEVNGSPAFLRRSRGYVPAPVYRDRPVATPVFAAGADLKNTVCFAKDDQYLISEHIGDLADGRVYRHYTRSVDHLRQLFDVSPEVAVCDLHPGYLSTHFAEQMPGVRLLRVQHHWAHIASVLVDCQHDGPVIGLVADGTGYGTDGAVWGCECLVASLTAFERFGHLAYYPLAGGDKAAKEAVRPLIGLLGDSVDRYTDSLLRLEPDADKIRLIRDQIQKNLNTVAASSLGRLFDAAAALLGLGTHNRFEAQLPMALEALVEKGVEDHYPIELQDDNGVWTWGHRPIIEGILQDRQRQISPSVAAARFHNSVCEGLLALAVKARDRTGLADVALSGGVFCNRYLANRLIRRLNQEQFRVLWKRSVPVNDGGISLGQAAIAAAILEKEKNHE